MNRVLVANARMYAINPRVAALWSTVFERVAQQAGVALTAIDHPPPLPLPELWQRDDLGCAFMCGYPYARWEAAMPRPHVLVAPLPSDPRYGGRPVYCTDIVVRSDAAFYDWRELRGKRFAYTIEHSQSGWHAPREHFASAAREAGGRWFGAVVGPLVTPREVVRQVLEGGADAGPLDSYWHDLLRRHEPDTAARLRTLVSTRMTPIPPLVCAASTPEPMRRALIGALADVGADATLRSVCDQLAIHGFAIVEPEDYRVTAELAREADAAGYVRMQ